jgi:hypothetical protein
VEMRRGVTNGISEWIIKRRFCGACIEIPYVDCPLHYWHVRLVVGSAYRILSGDGDFPLV